VPWPGGILRGKLDDQPENAKETAFSVRKYAGFNEPQRLSCWPGDSRAGIELAAEDNLDAAKLYRLGLCGERPLTTKSRFTGVIRINSFCPTRRPSRATVLVCSNRTECRERH
jgi:hypothetical protein